MYAKKGSLSDDLINQLARVLSFFFLTVQLTFFLLISFSFTQGDLADTTALHGKGAAKNEVLPRFGSYRIE